MTPAAKRAPKRSTPFTGHPVAKYCSVRYIAETLDCSLTKVGNMIRSGEIKALWVRGQYRVALTEFERFLEEAAKRARRP